VHHEVGVVDLAPHLLGQVARARGRWVSAISSRRTPAAFPLPGVSTTARRPPSQRRLVEHDVGQAAHLTALDAARAQHHPVDVLPSGTDRPAATSAIEWPQLCRPTWPGRSSAHRSRARRRRSRTAGSADGRRRAACRPRRTSRWVARRRAGCRSAPSSR
jgi:hypothetical protein